MGRQRVRPPSRPRHRHRPEVQNYVLEVNAHRSNEETIDILTCLLTNALRPDPSYRLPVPALLVHGQLDHIGNIDTDMRGWAHREPLARYAVIPDAGHASNLDNPAVFTNLLVEFIDQLPPTADTEPLPDLSDDHRTQECHLR